VKITVAILLVKFLCLLHEDYEETWWIPYGLKLFGDWGLSFGYIDSSNPNSEHLVYLESIYRTFLHKRWQVTSDIHRNSETSKQGHSMYKKDPMPRLPDNSRLDSTEPHHSCNTHILWRPSCHTLCGPYVHVNSSVPSEYRKWLTNYSEKLRVTKAVEVFPYFMAPEGTSAPSEQPMNSTDSRMNPLTSSYNSIYFKTYLTIIASKTSRPVLGPTQPPILHVLEFFHRGKAKGAWSC
jgi:hypothetical protein